MTMLKPQSIGDLSALRSGFAPRAFCYSPLFVGLAATRTITAGLEVLPPLHLTLMKLQADIALLWQCLQSCYLAGLRVQCQAEKKPLRLHLLFYLLG